MSFLKSMAIIGIAALLFATAIPKGKPKTKQYPATFRVTDFETETDSVVCVDCNGNEWMFQGIEDWCVGDCVSAIMDDNGTEIIYDDSIISVRYNSWEVRY